MKYVLSEEIILIGEIKIQKHINIIRGINEEIGKPRGHLELPNLSSHNWMHDDMEVSANFMTNTEILKVIVRK